MKCRIDSSKRRRLLEYIPFLFAVSLVLASLGAVTSTAVAMPRTIRVVMDKDYAPYVFQSNDGRLQGILVDQWQAWEKNTGIKVEIHAMDWSEALRRMRAGEFDVIDCIVETAERRDYLDFTPEYATIEASVFFRQDISGIADLASLKGFPVGVKVGDQHIDRLEENGVTTVILFQNNAEIIEAAKQRKVNVFVVDAPSALYLLNKNGIEGDFRHSAPIFRDKLRRAVLKGHPALLRTVSDGFAAIAPGELKQIDEKWFGSTINRYGRYLTYAGYAAAVTLLLVAILVGWNRTLRKRILQRTAALETTGEQLRALMARLQSAREEEGTRIARELHDEFGSALISLKWDVEFIDKLFAAAPDTDYSKHRDKTKAMTALIDATIGSVTRIASELRPGILDALDLVAALEWQARQLEARAGIICQFVALVEELHLQRETATSIFRIFQEAMTNVLRHAHATRVDIMVAVEAGEVVLEIRDNGRGITEGELAAPGSLGLMGMRERAHLVGARIEIKGVARHGTMITLRVPIQEEI
ncbi:MAG TPA: transporter substrate-binding domain-containing protein [Vicinamibacterales bacterium]|nr:transporter substrate-binding domain-containing protein [Vicinamibacterales bacterium]